MHFRYCILCIGIWCKVKVANNHVSFNKFNLVHAELCGEEASNVSKNIKCVSTYAEFNGCRSPLCGFASTGAYQLRKWTLSLCCWNFDMSLPLSLSPVCNLTHHTDEEACARCWQLYQTDNSLHTLDVWWSVLCGHVMRSQLLFYQQWPHTTYCWSRYPQRIANNDFCLLHYI